MSLKTPIHNSVTERTGNVLNPGLCVMREEQAERNTAVITDAMCERGRVTFLTNPHRSYNPCLI
jgi:hypothetical protein